MSPDRVAVLYARVSDEEKQDPVQMLRSLRVYADSRGWVVASEHSDRVTGDPSRRGGDPPGLRAALASVASRGGRGVLVVTSADRLVRSPVELLQMVARIQAAPGAVASIEDGADLDTTSDFGELVIFMRGWFGRMYLKFVRRNTSRVLDDRKRQIAESGTFLVGSPRSKRFGQRVAKLGRPGLDPALVEGVRRAWREGKSPPSVARALGIGASTVRDYYGRFRGAEKGAESGQTKPAEYQGIAGETPAPR